MPLGLSKPFQYHTGPIKRNVVGVSFTSPFVFQYHTGPIKRPCALSSRFYREFLFQYHTGPIKSSRARIEAALELCSFNTTLVQLKDRPQIDYTIYALSFNTTLVQLKGTFAKSHTRRTQLFQYHTGPIKSIGASRNTKPQILSFNTTLVQLKVRRRQRSIAWDILFQYHTGPIKSEADEAAPQGRRRVSIPHWSN